MNKSDNKFIKEVISTDLKKISNPDFTLTTLEKIKESQKENSINIESMADLTLIYPAFGFSFLVILFSIIKVISSWVKIEQIDKILDLTVVFSSYLFQPITLSLITTFTLLYLFDSYLKKQGAKSTKTLTQYT